MKKDQNLIKITNILTSEVRYFTKDSYVQSYIGCSISALKQIKNGGSPKYQNWKYELVDGSEIKYKYINEIF